MGEIDSAIGRDTTTPLGLRGCQCVPQSLEQAGQGSPAVNERLLYKNTDITAPRGRWSVLEDAPCHSIPLCTSCWHPPLTKSFTRRNYQTIKYNSLFSADINSSNFQQNHQECESYIYVLLLLSLLISRACAVLLPAQFSFLFGNSAILQLTMLHLYPDEISMNK